MTTRVPALKVTGVLRIPERINAYGNVCGQFTKDVLLYELAKVGLDATISDETVSTELKTGAGEHKYTELTLDMTIVGLYDNNVSTNLFIGFMKHHHIDGTRLSVMETKVPGHVYGD